MSVISLKEPEVVIREKRLGSITGFEGKASDLVQRAQAGKLHECTRSFSQCMNCGSGNALCQLSMIRDAAIVNHAPVGCAGDFFNYNLKLRR